MDTLRDALAERVARTDLDACVRGYIDLDVLVIHGFESLAAGAAHFRTKIFGAMWSATVGPTLRWLGYWSRTPSPRVSSGPTDPHWTTSGWCGGGDETALVSALP